MTELRAALADDADAIAQVWYEAWVDGHLGHVPAALVPHRSLEDFRRRVPAKIHTATVAVQGEAIVGFAMVRGDEVEQVFVSAAARGTGVAGDLLTHAEATVARGADAAWLAVVDGNARARRFYARQGWHDAGPLEYSAEIDGGNVLVPCRRYEKTVRDGR